MLSRAAGVPCARWFFSERRKVGGDARTPGRLAQDRVPQFFAGMSVLSM
jgi:hypothetical protein